MIYADMTLRLKTQEFLYLGPWAPPFTPRSREEVYRKGQSILAEFGLTLVGNEVRPEVVRDARAFLQARGWSEAPFEVVRVSVTSGAS